MNKKPNISKQAFWDIKFEDINFVEHANWLILRVCLYGSDNDLKELTKYYGTNKVKSIVDIRMIELNNFTKSSVFIDREIKRLQGIISKI
jgi:hypothetical protein